ncbi:alpha-N-acetylgalactosaminidase, partial [Streptococcus suis]
SGYYVELGQPIYANSFFFGMEFPMGDNRLVDQTYFSRYYVCHEIKEPKKNCPVVIGAASGFEK